MHKNNIKLFFKRDLTTTSLITLHWDTGSQHWHPQRIFLTLSRKSLSRVESSPAPSSTNEDDGDNIYIISEETYSLIKNVSYLLPPSCFIFFYLIFFYSCRSQIQCSPGTLILTWHSEITTIGMYEYFVIYSWGHIAVRGKSRTPRFLRTTNSAFFSGN